MFTFIYIFRILVLFWLVRKYRCEKSSSGDTLKKRLSHLYRIALFILLKLLDAIHIVVGVIHIHGINITLFSLIL